LLVDLGLVILLACCAFGVAATGGRFLHAVYAPSEVADRLLRSATAGQWSVLGSRFSVLGFIGLSGSATAEVVPWFGSFEATLLY